MLISEMEESLKNLDRRVGHIEQILPTLATKTDLERFATKAELDDRIRGVRVLIEDVRGDYRLLAEHVSSLMQDSEDAKHQFVLIHRRLDQMVDVLQRLDRRRREPE